MPWRLAISRVIVRGLPGVSTDRRASAYVLLRADKWDSLDLSATHAVVFGYDWVEDWLVVGAVGRGWWDEGRACKKKEGGACRRQEFAGGWCCRSLLCHGLLAIGGGGRQWLLYGVGVPALVD